MTVRFKSILFIIIIIFAFLSCNSAKTVSKNELMDLTKQWTEPKIAIWYYKGTKDGYDYFYFIETGNSYKINTNEITIDSKFPYTEDNHKWKVMPWGSLADEK